jgi:molybdopterin/thiamine biosynthesis adenylyltransferase
MAKLVVVGAGGNIGSHLVPHLARLRSVSKVVVIDRDSYEEKNLESQDIERRDVGAKKARVQARKLRRINPALEVEALVSAVEDLPLGKLRAEAILACLDSRRSRQYVNHAALRLGVPWIDAGVEADGFLARVNVYVPGENRPCLECAWDERDYENLEVRYPCSPDLASAAPTNAPSGLGALAASLQAIECSKLLDGESAESMAGKQILLDTLHHKHYRTCFRFNHRCRVPSHTPWSIERLKVRPEELSLRELFALAGNLNGCARLLVEGSVFVRKLRCLRCGHARSLLRLSSSLGESGRKCRRCGGTMVAGGFDQTEFLEVSDIRDLGRTAPSIGFRMDEVFTLSTEREDRHFQITGDEE